MFVVRKLHEAQRSAVAYAGELTASGVIRR